ncbi:MAG: helix-turn-helix transcriptional regulator [Lawsonibacter sp.]|nr:helix-turn-helix transcriptional regulator [Lawsonibacter sp.]
MKDQKGSFRRMIRRNSVFSRIFYGLLLLSFLVLTAFYFSINVLNTRYHREQLASSSLNLLSQAASAVDLTFDAMAQSMGQVLWNRDFVNYMVNPKEADQSLYYRIQLQLHNSVNGTSLVDTAIFFSPLSDKIFQNSSGVGIRDGFADQAMLAAYDQANFGETGSSSTRTAIVFYQSRLFFVEEINIASPLGVMIYELNLAALQEQFLQLENEKHDILVLDAAGTSVFGQTKSSLDLSLQGAFLTYENASERAAGQFSGYYRFTDQSSGWNFLLPIDQERVMISVGRILEIYVPGFLLILLCSLLFAWYISHTVYRPIDTLMQMVTKPGTEKAQKLNEMDFLEAAFETAMQSTAQLEGIVGSIAPEIIESMLKNLLVGKTLSEERIREILSGVGNPFPAQGRFFVIACVMEPPEEREVNDVELNLHLLAIRNLVGGLSGQWYRVYDIRTEKLTVALVFCFSQEQQIGALTQEYRRFKRLLQSNSELLPFQLRCERGNIYENLWDIRYSYREAVEKIQYAQYMQSAETDQGPSVQIGMNQSYFQQQAKHIVSLTAENCWVQAQASLMQLLDEIGDKASDLEHYKALVQMLMDETLERVITYPLAKEDQEALNRCRMRLENTKIDQEQDVVKAVQEDYQMIFRMIAAYSKKNRYRYIEISKEYIAQNYMDSNLSLNRVSDHVGISASYLSELFNEINHEKFTSYLAAFRVEKARQLLWATNLTSKEIGFRCGFSSVQNFIRVFKKCIGVTPGQYREEVLGMDVNNSPEE